jgi:alpha-beta hydrolase superfamily lysophospholipase
MLLVHGIGEHSGRYDHIGRRFAKAGIDVVAIDLPGFGGSGGRRAYIRAFDDYVDDVTDQLAEVRRLGLPTVLYGHSMGGLVSLLVVLQHRCPQPDLLVLSGPALRAGIPRVLELVTPIAARLAPILPVPSPIKGDVLATDPAVAEAYFADVANVFVTTPALGAELLRASRWARAHLSDLDVPTLVLHGGIDRLVPTACSEELGALPGVERRVLEGLCHEIHNEPGNEQLVDEIVTWIDAHLPFPPPQAGVG